MDFILKGVNNDGMLPDSVKAQEDAELSDITLYTDERVRVVNVRRDSRIRFFFTTPPDADRREQLKRATRTDAFPCGSRPLMYPIWRFRVHYAPPLMYPIGRFRVRLHC